MKWAYLFKNWRFQGKAEAPPEATIILWQGNAYLRHSFGTTWVFEYVESYTINTVSPTQHDDPKLHPYS